MELTFHTCTQDDLGALQALSRRTFEDTFAALNTPENLKSYLDEAFGTERLRSELTDPDSVFYFLYADGILSGYLKLNEAPAQTDLHDDTSLELERIYVAAAAQGKGFGRILMDRAIDEARARGKAFLWLGVWEKNERALRFYRKSGFYKAGEHSFFVGPEEQTDHIMRRDLS